MNERQNRVADKIRSTLTENILEAVSGVGEDYGVITVLSVDVSRDGSHADIYVHATEREKEFLQWLATQEGRFRHEIAGELPFRRVPTVRFHRPKKNAESTTDIYSLLDQVAVEYATKTESAPDANR